MSPLPPLGFKQFVPPVTNSFESIATVTVGAGGSSSISFTSIPSTFKHLQVRVFARASGAPAYSSMRFNNDSGANYNYHMIYANGSTATADYGLSTTSAGADYINSVASTFGVSIWDVLDYTNTNKNRTIRVLSGYDSNGAGQVRFASGIYTSTTAVNRIDLFPTPGNYTEYSHFALYGIRG